MLKRTGQKTGVAMTLADYSMTAFALLNGGRIIAYMPQIMCIYRDRNGAAAVSLMTWSMFAAANLATVSYSLTVSSDFVVAAVFAMNAVCCLAITFLVARRRVAVASWRGTRAKSRAGQLARPFQCGVPI